MTPFFCLWLILLPLLCYANTSASNVDQIKDYFEKQGFVVLRNFFEKSQLEPWQRSASSFFGSIFQIMHDKGHTAFPEHSRLIQTPDGSIKRRYSMGEGRQRGFQEIVMRSPGRYEISLEALSAAAVGAEETPTLKDVVQKLAAIVPPMLHTTATNMSLASSLIVSTPDAPEQNWHADGEHVDMKRHMPAHCISVFVPLINVTTVNLGPTELYPTSHYTTRQPSPMKIEPAKLPAAYAPLLNVGDILVFDYRLLHRGKANMSTQNRPMLVLSFSQAWFRDDKNWPERSLSDS